jgi:hypothetical protein
MRQRAVAAICFLLRPFVPCSPGTSSRSTRFARASNKLGSGIRTQSEAAPRLAPYFRYAIYDDSGSIYKYLEGWPVPEHEKVYHGVGYSALGVLSSTILGIIIVCVSVAVGFRNCAPGLPLGPTNSMVIAAACHTPTEDRNPAIKAVQWGVVPTANDAVGGDRLGHCTITSAHTEEPVEGRWYA